MLLVRGAIGQCHALVPAIPDSHITSMSYDSAKAPLAKDGVALKTTTIFAITNCGCKTEIGADCDTEGSWVRVSLE